MKQKKKNLNQIQKTLKNPKSQMVERKRRMKKKTQKKKNKNKNKKITMNQN